jgi:hypothetical protein
LSSLFSTRDGCGLPFHQRLFFAFPAYFQPAIRCQQVFPGSTIEHAHANRHFMLALEKSDMDRERHEGGQQNTLQAILYRER